MNTLVTLLLYVEWGIVLKNRLSKLSIRYKIFLYIFAIGAGFIALLWLFQIVFLNDFYEFMKTQEIKEVSSFISDNVESEELELYIDELVENSDYCVRIVDLENQIYYENSESSGTCGFLKLTENEVDNLYDKALEEGGSSVTIRESLQFQPILNGGVDNANRLDINHFQSEVKSLTITEISEVANKEYLVMVSSNITLVGEIVNTLQVQLLIVSAIFLIAGMLVAFIMAQRISAPIIKINESAKKLATGDYSIEFEGEGYREISELNVTLNHTREELGKVEQQRRELIANMSHDLRTPLTMIGGYSEMMRDIPGENTPENVQVIIDECARLTSLVNDILDLSKLQSSMHEMHVEDCNLTKLLKEIALRVQTLLKSEGYQIQVQCDEEIYVRVDVIKINQVIYNLLVNAINYAGEDKIVILSQTKVDDRVLIEIEDHGEGIEEEQLDHVWQRYYKSKNPHMRAQIGTGLGLSIVQSILEMHRAEYGVRSTKQEGTTFYFYLEINK